jgi:UDP-N-acetylglucosamine/UDP-N-acetylgalactosamine diphosphorylase
LSHKTLFQLQTERIVRLQQLAALETNNSAIQIPYYILTSPLNYEETRQYFMDNAYFGLAAEQVYFFNQDSLPCFSLDGKILLESKHSMALAPNGNGGVYQALESNGLFSDMEKRGIKHIHSYSVDNVLVKPADPVFMASCARRQIEFGTKVVPKRDAHERVGVFALKNNRFHVVEYSEISKEMAERIDPETKQLAFNAANIVNFYYSFDFIVKCAQIMKTHRIYHVAKKSIPALDPETGKTMEPKNGQNNGIKLELFNFDICEFADKVAILEVDRTMEFSPLKNGPNEGLPDSPETCRRDLSRVSKLYIERRGGRFTNGDNESLLCEVSPLLSYGGEGLEPIVKDKVFTLPLYLTK